MKIEELKEKILELGVSFVVDDIGYKDLQLVEVFHSPYYDGQKVEVIYKHEDFYIKLSGWYTSYEGVDWDEKVIQVAPKQITVVTYEPVENQ
jgi:hypothetical protein